MVDTLRTLASLFKRPDVIGWTVMFSVTGTLLGIFVLPDQWSFATRALGGFAMGFNGVLYVVGPRMIGGDDFDG
jgi:hypothetical protein